MKNLIIVFAVISILGIGAYINSKKSKSPNLVFQQKTNNIVENISNDSLYTQFNKTEFDNSTTYRRVLFFYASWCPTCRPADVNFTQNIHTIPQDVRLFRVNYNDPETDQDEKDLAHTYQITYQHTFVQIDATGKEIAKWNGGAIDELLTHLK